MDDQSKQKYQFRAEIFKALSNPVRIEMLDHLKKRPWCVCELAAAVGIDKSVASKHLSQLKAVGIIDDVKHGTMVEYRLIANCLLDSVACAEEVILDNRLKHLESMRNG
jgi:ArsR family transcriptional regulator